MIVGYARVSTDGQTLLAQQASLAFKSLGDSWADTTTPAGKLMLTVLGGLAEYERHLILARTSEGRQRAQARGVRFGRRPKLTLHQQQEALARRAAGEALVDIARSYAVSHSTISRLA
jgi:DNA invertase Pin-like site-specific DNA recombinase